MKLTRVLANCFPRPLREREEFQHEGRVLEIRVRGGAKGTAPDNICRQYLCALPCHCEAERSEAVAIAKSLELNEITTSCALHTPRNDMKIICHPEAIAEGSQEKIPQQVRDDKSHFSRPRGEGLRERGLSAHDEIPKQVRNDKYLSEAHGKELNVLTSYRLNDFKKKIAFTLAEGATHVDMYANIRRVAFTLAEVLITLGIIGVVAAMTIPTLIANYREKVMVTKVKQGHSLLMNAIQLYMAQNNCINALCLFDTKKTSEQVAAELGTVLKGAKLCKAGDTGKFCKTYYYKANQPIKIDGVYGAGDSLGPRGRIYLPNGISFQTAQVSECPRTVTSIIRDENGFEIDRKEVVSEICAYIYMDVNNVEEPNQFGADMYRYDAKISGKVVPTNQKLLNSVLIYNKLEYTPYNIGDPIE